MRTLDLVWAWREERRRVTEHNHVETILRDFPRVVLHLRDAFTLDPDELGTDLAYARVNRQRDVLTFATTIRRIDETTSEWHLIVTRSEKQGGTPLTLSTAEGRSWSLALFGTCHAASITIGATLPRHELPFELHDGAHYAVRVKADARPTSFIATA
ncbi:MULTISPECIES: hypothetical protein [unclassified Pseudonocardia]|uniref:hypothetical protein n=1 Tax=unclassified Pseudonocardia TaxID=2619320 RepID=UPI001CF70942|nr:MULTISPECIES: hypothetical protein [unclassified Pseudonocardia]